MSTATRFFRPRERQRCRWLLCVPKVFASSLADGHATSASSPSSKPVRPHGVPPRNHRAKIRQNKLGNRGKRLGAISDDPLQATPMSDGPLPLKRDVAKMLLRKGSLFVHLDPRASDVFVPPWLRHQAQLVLQVGYDMPIPIPDLRVDDEGVFGTLSFSRNPFTCAVPWHAVFALVGDEGRGMVWPESMPPEIAAEVEREAMRSKLSGESGQAESGRAGLRAEISRSELDGPRSTSDSRGTRILREGPFAEIPGPRDREANVLRAAEPHGRGRRDSSRPGPGRSSSRRRALPPYLRVVK